MVPTVYFIENFNPISWAFSIWPRLFWQRFNKHQTVTACFIFDGLPLAVVLAKLSALITGVPVSKLEFRLANMKNQARESVRWRIVYGDLLRVQKSATATFAFRELTRNEGGLGRITDYLKKRLIDSSYWSRGNLWRSVHLIRVCQWYTEHQDRHVLRSEKGKDAVPQKKHRAKLFLEQIPWMGALDELAQECGVSIVPVRRSMNLRSRWRGIMPRWALDLARKFRYFQFGAPTRPTSPQFGATDEGRRARVAFEYYGQGNLDNPERHSDLFFWQQSTLDGADLLALLQFPQFPMNEQNWKEFATHGIGAIKLHPAASAVPGIPAYISTSSGRITSMISVPLHGPEGQWVRREEAQFQLLKERWRELFKQERLKVSLNWYKYTADHFAISDAMEDAGGISCIYQRAYEADPSAQNTISADIVFGFSQGVAGLERISGSQIKYHVTTGYLGDHRFELVRGNSQRIRKNLRDHGAKKILAFLDENSSDDPRWAPGHQFMQADYEFLLNKLLEEDWLGLVLKPKVPRTLRRRLGPVSKLLQQAEATGRCFIFEAHENAPPHGWHPPAEAGLASDLAVHGDLTAGTAGVECALAGVPTLLYDPMGWPSSPLYNLGLGETVFTDWETLWSACQRRLSDADGTSTIGDWTPLLDDIDPFRDGRASERIGTYVSWLLEGFRSGFDRERVMANAAERYCAAWGDDKITQVNWKQDPQIHQRGSSG
ncbi:MAG: hypothetical protein FI731_12030, partial [SAR202 cluster bacterium]|nr:hypothetical protein [SAR202 cluster bacterium]